MLKKAAVAGAGTMGSGIALSIAGAGFDVTLFDLHTEVLEKAKKSISGILNRMVEKGKLTAGDMQEIISRIHFTNNINDCIAEIIVEAIVEKPDAKVSLFTQLAAINSNQTILASNTSSLSITHLQQRIPEPGRVAGLHYFNPANLMKLVEVVKGEQTAPEVIEKLIQFCKDQKKTTVVCKDSPGFIVNRVARHFYLESLKALEEGRADIETIDAVLESAGFKMGPFKLMDMIGMDINYAVSQSLYEAYHHHPRFKPNPLQEEKVQQGKLGRKTGEGFYKYPSS